MCGVLGIRAFNQCEVKTLAYYSMQALQHRGQESAGVTWFNKHSVAPMSSVAKGSVENVFKDLDVNADRVSTLLGHTRYSTTGGDLVANIQPFIFTVGNQQISLVHNGNLVNTEQVTNIVLGMGLTPKGTTDSELIGLLICRYLAAHPSEDVTAGIQFAMGICKGAVSLIVSTTDTIYAYRDVYGIRPLILGVYETSAYVVASETCALDAIGAEYICTISPGTVVAINDYYFKYVLHEAKPPRKCIFEDIYFSRPDSIRESSQSQSIYEYRLELGKLLFKECPADVDLIIGTPDSGIPGAIGYAEASGIPYGEGLIKNKYIGRTFIKPTQAMRQQGVRLKLNPIPNVLKNKRIVLIDDSIVRGNTCKRTIESLRRAGAKEVHMRVTSPPVKHPCYFGLDFPDEDELIACQMNHQELTEFIGADTLGYLSIDACLDATKNQDATNSIDTGYCTACFTGKYPI